MVHALCRPRYGLLALICLVLAAGHRPARVAASSQNPAQGAAVTPVTIDLVVLDRDGRISDTLGPGDLIVTVDNKPRSVLWIRRVSRGPGAATDAALRQARGDGTIAFAAEPSRSVLAVIDQATFARGDERAAVQAAGAFLDRLGIDDRVAVVPIPLSSETQVALTLDRPAAREPLGRVVGQAPRAANTPIEDPTRNVAVDPEREKEIEAPPPAQVDPDAGREGFSGLPDLLKALRTIPGRKVIALFSAGLAAPAQSQLNDLAAAAVAAHTVIYTFGLPGSRGESAGLEVVHRGAPLETLAKSTGGSFATLGRNPERSLARVVAELSACYVLGIQAGESDADGRRHALRVEGTKKGVTLRAPAWLIPVPDADDEKPQSPSPIAGPVEPAAPAARGGSEARPATGLPSREAELQLALARLADYVSGYERQYSGLVAEEDYVQSAGLRQVRLRSDFLLVKPQNVEGWVSFRDVFEVDGHPVRDREDRLKRLFLDPSPEAMARLKSVKDESARYNIGPIERNVNVPLFPLVFLNPENRPRFQFKLAGSRQSAGLQAWRVEYKETARPTIINDHASHDVPVSGWFLVDQMTGAIVESGLTMSERAFAAEIVVSYRRDEALGLWVPARMKETYKMTLSPGYWAAASMEGQAIYSNFRRFQVKTEEKVAIPK